jgi:ribosomal protein S18 acetylase RimI-like enzyme
LNSADSPPFTLRAITQADYPWLWELKRLTMRGYVELTWGSWDDAAQERFFRQNFSANTVQIIVADGRDAGLLNVEREPDGLFLANIQIHPAFQNRGLGSAVVRTLIDSADALRLPLRLQVLKVNTRARSLYQQLGFSTYAETLTHFLMRHSPSPK